MSQAQAQYVKWVKDRYPHVFAVALKKAQRKTTLGGLGDDLLSDVNVNPDDITVNASVSQAVDNAANGTGSFDGSGFLDSLVSAITSVAPALVQTKADLAAIQLNQQRAAQNRGVLTGNSLITGAGIGSGTSLLMLAALGIGAIALIGGHKSR